jgi:hypothetical protein
MATVTRSEVRLLAVAVAFMLSGAQFWLFDCSKMPTLSVVSGVLTVLLLYGTGEAVLRIATSPRSTQAKLVDGGGVLLGGGALVALTGFFTLITHLCP